MGRRFFPWFPLALLVLSQVLFLAGDGGAVLRGELCDPNAETRLNRVLELRASGEGVRHRHPSRSRAAGWLIPVPLPEDRAAGFRLYEVTA